MSMLAVATQQDHWTGLAVVGGLLLLYVAFKRGMIGAGIVVAAAALTYGWKADEVQGTNINDRNTVGIIFLGAVVGALVAFALPLKGKA
jgi:hypothetical protein